MPNTRANCSNLTKIGFGSPAQALQQVYSSARAKFLLVAGYDSGVAGQAKQYGSDFSNAAVASMGEADQVGPLP